MTTCRGADDQKVEVRFKCGNMSLHQVLASIACSLFTGQAKLSTKWDTVATEGKVTASVRGNTESASAVIAPISRGSWPREIVHNCARRIGGGVAVLDPIACWVMADNGSRVAGVSIHLQIAKHQSTLQTTGDATEAVFCNVPISAKTSTYAGTISAPQCNLESNLTSSGCCLTVLVI